MFGNRVNLMEDKSKWVTSHERSALAHTLRRINIPYSQKRFSFFEACFFADKYTALSKAKLFYLAGNKLAFNFYHGDPYRNIEPFFFDFFQEMKAKKNYFKRIRVSNSETEELLLNEGFEDLVYKIPIGIDMNMFPEVTNNSRINSRKTLGIPDSALVIGSFQKDGIGNINIGDLPHEVGDMPKLIKGPDIFIETLKILKRSIPEIYVLLSGPCRGYLINQLETIGVAYKHTFLKNYSDIWRLYHALDFYLVSSREEGGPKSILESMATGIPIISTPVGQAQDLIKHGKNGWLSETFEPENLAYLCELAMIKFHDNKKIKLNGLNTANSNDYTKQDKMWQSFFSPMLHKL